jgi:two-component system OmpR family sensor kinase
VGFKVAAAGLAVAITLATFVLGWMLWRLLLRPIKDLGRFAGEGDGRPPDHFGTREIHATARRVITMAETLRDREATVRAFTDHVTHEIKTPVTAILAATELLFDGVAEADRPLLAVVEGAARQIETQLAALRTAARAREVRWLGQTCLAEVAPSLPMNVVIEGADVALPLAAEGLAVVLTQLCRNAVEAGATRVWLSASPGAGVIVADDGPGISLGNAARIFEPFFTTKREVGGTGMGLSVVRNLLEAHRATITLEDPGGPKGPGACETPHPGAVFRIRFG